MTNKTINKIRINNLQISKLRKRLNNGDTEFKDGRLISDQINKSEDSVIF